MSLDDTIAAIATPVGEGGIGIVRLSGKEAVAIADRLFFSPKGKRLVNVRSHSVLYGFIVHPETGRRIDEVLVTIMRAPRTYTREDVVEINGHGGTLPLRATLESLLCAGARLAEPGEFTKRAFLNGRIDLSQAEAVIDIIRAKTDEAERLALRQLEGQLSGALHAVRDTITEVCALIEAALDFPEEDVGSVEKDAIISSLRGTGKELSALSKGYDEGRFFREGVAAVIAGKPNVGKSSLLNALLQRDRAIVTEIPGTTRDVIEDYLNINGLPLRIMDTAGIRESHDLAEIEGVKRSLKAIDGADIVVAVLDASRPLDDADRELMRNVKDKRTLFVINKSDRASSGFRIQDSGYHVEKMDKGTPYCHLRNPRSNAQYPVVQVSALTGEGIQDLKKEICSLSIPRVLQGEVQGSPGAGLPEGVLITNVRHKRSIDKASKSLGDAVESLKRDEPLEITALFLRESLDHLGEIIGVVSTEDILERIFTQFCIGK